MKFTDFGKAIRVGSRTGAVFLPESETTNCWFGVFSVFFSDLLLLMHLAFSMENLTERLKETERERERESERGRESSVNYK